MAPAELISEKILETTKSKIRIYPCHVNRASSCGHPCERFLFYSRARWNERALHDVNLQMIFDEGSMHEEAVLRRLKESGVQVVEQQRPFEWKELELTGHIDCSIVLDGKAYPAEIKSMSPYTFDKTDSVDDMKNSKYVYMRGYPSQMYMYLLMKEIEDGLFVLKNKVNGWIKLLDVPLDYEAADVIVKKLERVNQALKANKEPDWIKDAGVCGDCGFKQICLPALQYGEGVMIGSEELVQLIEEQEELERKLEEPKAVKKRLEEVKELIKEMTKDKESVIAGNYLISGKWVERKGFEVKPSRYWTVEHTRIMDKAA